MHPSFVPEVSVLAGEPQNHPMWFWNSLCFKCALRLLPNRVPIVAYLGGFPSGANYKYHLRAHFWYMHLFLYSVVFRLDGVPEAMVRGLVAHAGWLGSKSVS